MAALVVGDEDVRAAHWIQLVITIVERFGDVPAFPERNRQNPLAVPPNYGFVQRNTKSDVTGLRPAWRLAVRIVTAMNQLLELPSNMPSD